MMIFTDKPIENEQEDTLGRKEFVETLATTILSYEKKENFVIGLNGKWGSGKTSIMNMLERHIMEKCPVSKYKYIFLRFNPWNFKDQDELIQSFFKEIYSQLHIIDWHKLKRNIDKALDFAEELLNIVKSIKLLNLARNLKDYAKLLERLPFKKSLEQTKDKINSRLGKFKGKLIIYIDDIDRLNDKEINQIFQLVKLLANFDNVIYVLSYDHNVVISALETSQKNHSEEYLEKIIQLPISIPNPAHSRLEYKIETELKSIVGNFNILKQKINWDKLEMMNFYGQFDSIREINRFINIFQLKYVPLREEVDPLDFALITLFEIKFNKIYKFIYKNKGKICGINRKTNNLDESLYYQKFKDFIDAEIEKYYTTYKDFLMQAFRFLFPKYNVASSQESWHEVLSRSYAYNTGRLFIEEKFDLYFSLSFDDLIFSNVYMRNILLQQTQEEFIDSIEKIYNEDKFENFVFDLCERVNLIPIERFDNIIRWLFNITNTSIETMLYKWSNNIAKMVINFYKHNRALFIKVKELIDNSDITYLVIKIMIRLESEHGRFYDQSIVEGGMIDLNELLELENIIKEKLEKQFDDTKIINIKWFREKFYFMLKIDNQFMLDWCTSLSKDDDAILHLLTNIVNIQFNEKVGASELVANYFCEIETLKQILDMDKCYNLVSKKVKAWKSNKNDKLYSLLAFLKSYEDGLGFAYDEIELDKYFENKMVGKE